jgi:predicted acyl esterase
MSLLRRRRRFVLLVATFATLCAAPSAAIAADVPPGATWTETTIPSTDGVQLHADILRPSDLPENAKTPVILSIGPYFNHSGQTGPAGPVEGTSYDPVGPSTGPSDRFLDFVEGARLMERGYTFMMVDLRGFGGSTGCLDWAGPGEQSDVVNAVEWAASREWSNGKVGMYGKSYDGVTGLIGVNRQPEGLEAVVSQEPVYDLYRYLYGDGMRRQNSVLTPALYDAIDATPGPIFDDPAYNISGANDTQRPGCKPVNWAEQAGNEDHFSPYWRKRNLIPGAKGSDVPLFLTQGLTEQNTVADGTAQYLNRHSGYERAWLGPWDHVRGNETEDDGRLKMGRAGFFDEVMRFYGRFLKGGPKITDPTIAVQTNDGKWRAEETWPPADSTGYTSELLPGTYNDNGSGSVTGSDGVWTISPVLPYDAHLSGSGKAIVDVSSNLPRGNLVVDVYDLSQDDEGNWTGPLITRQGHMIYNNGEVPLTLWSADWKVLAGHRIGVRVTDANSDWWTNVPTMQDVTVYGGEVTLPFLADYRKKTIQGDPGTMLDGYLAETVAVPPETIESSESASFALPPKMAGWKPSPPPAPAGPAQAPVTGTVTTGTPGAGQRSDATSSYLEFDVDAVHDNAKMQGVATPTAPADLDLYLQRQAADGSWAAAGDGTNGGDLDGETIGTGRLAPGHYRLEVHNWAGPPGNQVSVTLTFLNSDGKPGT